MKAILRFLHDWLILTARYMLTAMTLALIAGISYPLNIRWENHPFAFVLILLVGASIAFLVWYFTEKWQPPQEEK